MNSKRVIKQTADGSKTIYLPDFDEHYHSVHGAIQESNHVFLKHGLQLFSNRKLSVLEIGFGTGLNTLLTYFESKKLQLKVCYTTLEAYPIPFDEILDLDYCSHVIFDDCQNVFKIIHQLPWEEEKMVDEYFRLHKLKMKFQDLEFVNQFDLVYFDAFGARVQPELWTIEIFRKVFEAMKYQGVLVTYSAKGSVRRSMLEVGFEVEKLPGPPGKREMLRARKIKNV